MPPESPKPEPSSSRLSPVFVPEVLFPNPNLPPTYDELNNILQQELIDQVQEQLIDEDEFCWCMMNIPNQVIMQIWQDIEGGQIDWVNYQGRNQH